MSVLREKYAHLSLVLRKQIDASFVIDGRMFINPDDQEWEFTERNGLPLVLLRQKITVPTQICYNKFCHTIFEPKSNKIEIAGSFFIFRVKNNIIIVRV